jgi:regulator of replication initiation timing
MKPTEAQAEAEALLRLINAGSTLRLIEEIKKLRCENAILRERIAKLMKTNGKDNEPKY